MMQDAKVLPAIFSGELVRRILAFYDHDGGDAPEILPMPQGFGMALVRIRSAGLDWVIKQLSPDRPPERRRYALLYQAHMQAAGVPCPRLHRTRNSELLVTIDGSDFSVIDWCEGERFEPDQADLETRRHHRRAMGALLGQLHAAVTPELAQSAPASCRHSPAGMFAQLPSVTRGLPWSGGGRLARDVWLLSHERGGFGREIRRIIPVLEEARSQLVASPLGNDPRLATTLPVHGDFHFENVLFTGGRVAGLLDFDNAAIASRAFDIGSAMAVVCQEREHEDDFLAAFAAAGGGRPPGADLLRACVRLRLLNSLSFQIVAYTNRHVRCPEKARWWIRRLSRLLVAELAADR